MKLTTRLQTRAMRYAPRGKNVTPAPTYVPAKTLVEAERRYLKKSFRKMTVVCVNVTEGTSDNIERLRLVLSCGECGNERTVRPDVFERQEHRTMRCYSCVDESKYVGERHLNRKSDIQVITKISDELRETISQIPFRLVFSSRWIDEGIAG